ncbi:MAG: MFS transporter [Proteobacteria bacterium]|nr:MFS transporter [Pseudomonadota bacterium]
MLGFSTFPALQPALLAEWVLSNTEAGWINGIYFAAYMAAAPVLVSLTDRVDPRRVYAIGAVVSVFSAVGFALLAEGFWSALVMRGLSGMGLAGTYMPGLKALTDHIDERLRSRAVAFYTASLSIGFALSFLFAGEIAAWLDWRWAFAILGLGSAVALPLVLILVPPSEPHHLVKPDTALLDFRPVLRNRRALGYVLAYSAHNWELFAFRSWIVTFLVFSQGLQGEGALGLGWSATALAALIGVLGLPASVLGNEAAQRFGRRRTVILVMSASAAISLAVGFLAALPFVLLVAVTMVYSFTVSGDSSAITAGAIEAAAPGQRGATMAVHSFIGFAGAFVGPLVFGVVLDLAGGRESLLAWGLAFASAGLAVAMGPVAMAVLGRRPASATGG